MEPLVTIVIPTYNRVSLVGRAIASARSQRYLPLHIVVVDDGSTDATPALLASMRPEPSLTVVRHDMNRGASAAKNTGLDNMPAETAFFGILDSDDELRPGAVRALVAAFDAAGAPFSQVFGWCEDPVSGERTGSAPVTAGTISYVDSLCGRFAGEFWQLARADLLDGQRFDERALGGEGWLWTRLLRKAPAYLISDTVRQYDRSGPDRISIPAYDRRSAIGTMWSYRTFLDGLGKDIADACPHRYGLLLAEAAKWGALAGDRRYAARAALAAIRYAPSRRSLGVALAPLLPSALLARLAVRRSRGRLE